MKLRAPALLAVLTLTLATLGAEVSAPALDGPDPVTFGQRVRMPMEGHVLLSGASEPSIAVDADGTIYITAACCLGVAAPAWYSKDGGATFQLMRSPGGVREATVGAEGDFVVDDADRPILVDTRVPSLVVSRWRDHGDTWERSVEASEVTVPLQDRPWLAWGGGALYLYVNGGLQNTYVYRSADEGVTWSPIPLGSFSGNFPTNLAVNRQDGTIWLVGRNGFTSPDVSSFVSTDRGATWNQAPVARASRGAVSPTTGLSVATDEGGNGYAVWSTFDQNGCDIEMAVSSDHGATWRGPFRVSSATGACATFAWADAGAPGRVVVTWLQADTPKNQAQMPGGAEWHVHAAVSTDALSDDPAFQEARLPGHVVDRGTLTTGYGQPGGASRSLLDFFEVATGPDGRFHIAYAANAGQNGVDETWYVGQDGGPLLHANRIAEATEVRLARADVADGILQVEGTATFKRAPVTTVFERESASLGGEVTRVGPDSDELLATILTPPAGTPAYDNLPGAFAWAFEANGEPHELEVTVTPAGPQFTLDGDPIGGTVDAHDGRAVARVSLSAVGAAPGDVLRFRPPGVSAVDPDPGAVPYTVPEATVRLSLQRAGVEVAAGEAMLDEIATGFAGVIDVAGLEAGPYELVTTACYAGDCSSATSAVAL